MLISRMGFRLRGDKISVTYQPFKEIVILDKTRFNSPDDLARFASIISGGKPSGLYWAEGVLILYFLLPSSTNTAAKELVEKGRVYWTMVGYAFMEDYKPVIETKEKIIVPVIDMSSNTIIRKVANWLKRQEK